MGGLLGFTVGQLGENVELVLGASGHFPVLFLYLLSVLSVT